MLCQPWLIASSSHWCSYSKLGFKKHQSKLPPKNKERHLLIAHRYPILRTWGRGGRNCQLFLRTISSEKKSFLNTFNHSAVVSTSDSRLFLSSFALFSCYRSAVNSISQFKDTYSLQWEPDASQSTSLKLLYFFWQEGAIFQWKTDFQVANYKVVVKDWYFKGLLALTRIFRITFKHQTHT